jgi:hypothetical protein
MYGSLATNLLRDGIMFTNIVLAALLAGASLIIAMGALAKAGAAVRVRRR